MTALGRISVRLVRLQWFLLFCLFAGFSLPVHAVPSFARQTGMPCSGCHTMFPELNSTGRHFKLNGYTLTGSPQVSQDSGDGQAGVSINAFPPLSFMLQTGVTHLAKTEPDTQNNDLQFPQELALFYAGRISPRMGAFVEFAYEQSEGEVEFDAADIRYASPATDDQSLIYGLTLNNAPGLQDVWNTLPVWGFPWVASGSAPTPTAGPILGQLSDVAGLGAYVLWNNTIYAEAAGYRSTPQGQAKPGAVEEEPADPTAPTATNTIDGVAPYVRLAWQHDGDGGRYLMVGLHGFLLERYPEGLVGPKDRYKDAGVDAQFEQPMGGNLLVVHAVYTREEQTLNASAAGFEPTLQTARADIGYHWGNRAAFTVGYWDTDGDSGDYSASYGYEGSPDNRGWVGTLSFHPWQNTKLSLAYTAYDKFDGLEEGAGRDESDNDTAFLQAWLAW